MTKKEQFIEKYGEERYEDVVNTLDSYRDNYELALTLLEENKDEKFYIVELLKRAIIKYGSVKEYFLNSLLCTEEEFDIYEEWYSGRA